MKHATLFSGIGGPELAAEWMGWENVFHCEINPFGRRVLEYYWPESKSYEDITKTDFTIWRGKIDILTAGFPCQPFSNAGKRKGTEDDRHLWPETLRAIREIRPRWVVGENVPGIINWSKGMVFEMVCTELENEGYKVQPIEIPAVSVEAQHERFRVLFIAYDSNSVTGKKTSILCNENYRRIKETIKKGIFWNKNNISSGLCDLRENKKEIVSDCSCELLETQLQSKPPERQSLRCNCGDVSRIFREFPTQSPICARDDGFSEQLDAITFPKWRNESTKAAGNAIAPQVIYQIYKTIQDFENLNL